MCRTDMGECVAEGCTGRITCQDTGGYCNEHDPFDFAFCDCEGDECSCPPRPPRPADNEVKRLLYGISRTERYIDQQRIASARATQEERKAHDRLHTMKIRLGELL